MLRTSQQATAGDTKILRTCLTTRENSLLKAENYLDEGRKRHGQAQCILRSSSKKFFEHEIVEQGGPTTSNPHLVRLSGSALEGEAYGSSKLLHFGALRAATANFAILMYSRYCASATRSRDAP